MSKPRSISAILAIRPDQIQLAAQSIEALRHQSLTPREIILVVQADASKAESLGLGSSVFSEVKVVHQEWADRERALNVGIANSASDYVALVDPGALPDPRCLEILHEEIERTREHGVVAATANPFRIGQSSANGFLRRAQVWCGVRQVELVGCMNAGGFCRPVDVMDALGGEPFDVDVPTPGLMLALRAALMERPFPEGISLLHANGSIFHGVHLTRTQRMLFVPQAGIHYTTKEPSARQDICTAYWLMKTFQKRALADFVILSLRLLVLMAVCGRFGEAFDGLRGFMKCCGWQIRRVSLRNTVLNEFEKVGGTAPLKGLIDPTPIIPMEMQTEICRDER